ncbi:ATP-dependent DNA helicase [Nakamurella sp. PAMC28650]|uniref:ATP-dependent helicase n=1 Tax=Nakamurella sp. PAMC28650 TaxID=2762325 RepID=UPI00164E8836|nr:ATP-dependent DNA helicase [Nakamurella sp. PAMC28650]QNK80134.1 ATP-dependent helicase [Nakamurella sp. PAMC28650]
MITAGRLAEILALPPPTDEQAAVIEAPMAPALVVAGAGSGKTETMAARVLYLVANDLVRPEQILGLTFTRKAASGLAGRIRQRLRTLAAAGVSVPGQAPAPTGGEPEVSTYHSFGGRLIAEFGPLAGIEPASRVLSATGSWLLARRVVGRWDGDLNTDLGPDQVTERLLSMSGGLADHLIDATTLSDEIEQVLARLRAARPSPAQKAAVHSGLAGHLKRLQDRAWILPLVDAFTEAKRRAGVVDFADQMQVAAKLVTDHARIGQALRERHRVVLLDEYQDTGHVQRVILRAVFAETGVQGTPSGHPVTAVGDPVQSIYSWRGASASNLPRFPSDFPCRNGIPAATLTLSTSFRNASSVLGIANQLSAEVRSGAVQVQELRPRPGADVGEVRYGLFATAAEEERWVAQQIARRWEMRSATGDGSSPSTAVLMRRRRDMEPMAMALRAAGLPVEVVGLGGLLNEPEIADLLAMLRVLVDPTAGPAAVRLLTGARWQLGMADLAALSSRASVLSPRGHAPSGSAPDGGGNAGRASVREALVDAGSGEEIDSASIIDALSDPGPPENYSPEGFRRLQRLGAELHRLRARLSLPLGDLVAELERTSGLDVEVRISSPAGRAHLDAFADVVADFSAGGGGAVELVEYLVTAADREDGLTPGEVAPTPGRVQVLTVHAAKGLEWEIVAVPHLSDTVFPSSRGSTWLGDAGQLPPSLRGDRADLPQLQLPSGGDQRDMVAALTAHAAALKADQAVEERRLLYVAVTRAERTLLASGHQWGRTGSTAHGPSRFLTEIRSAAEPSWLPDEWADEPGAQEGNPMTSAPRTASWPSDPLGDRRRAIASGADLVLGAIARRQLPDPGEAVGEDQLGWSRDVAALLEERRALRSTSIEVALPQSLSATALVELAADPAALARRIRRPVPHPPAPRARRGTDFHAWLERFYTGSALMEISELPGAHDNGPEPDAELELLKARFQRSDWSRRMPFEVELPFSMTIAGQPVRGRIDAVFRDDDGGCTVVDWKTGHPPSVELRKAATVQLAVYRLAVAEMLGLPLTKVRAAFVYVATDDTFAPADLLDADGLSALIIASTSIEAHVG